MILHSILLSIVLTATLASTPSFAADVNDFKPITIIEQGSFAAGGTVKQNDGEFDPYLPLDPTGQSFHGDHAYAFFQKPVNPKKNAIVMLHGAGQFSKTWETTPDGREGFQTLFLRRGYSIYVVDQPRRGNAGRSMAETTLRPTADEQMWFNQFRIGVWPAFHDDVQFPEDREALNQFFRQMTPNTGPFNIQVASDGISAVIDKAGPTILFTHSQGGGVGWYTALKNDQIKAIVSFEPGSNFIFPQGEVPAPIKNAFDIVAGEEVPMETFKSLTHLPVLIIYGDYIPDVPVDLPPEDAWRARLQMAKIWRDTVNKHGGDVTLIHLPEIGIKGNTHFPFSDTNNVTIAELVEKFLHDKKLD